MLESRAALQHGFEVGQGGFFLNLRMSSTGVCPRLSLCTGYLWQTSIPARCRDARRLALSVLNRRLPLKTRC